MILPLITVIIPVYNADKYLARCLDSVLAQTYSNIDVLVVNDGSTDGSAGICGEYEKKDMRVRVIHKDNGGSAEARNVALDNTRGEYIAWVDADDFVHPTFLEALYGLCITFNAEISMCRYDVVYDSTLPEVPGPSHEPDCLMDFAEYGAFLYSPREIEMVVLWNKLYKSGLWEGIRFPVGKHIDDGCITWKLVYNAEGISVSTKPLYYYFISPQSVMRGTGSSIRQMDGIEMMEERMDFLDSNGFAFLAFRTELSILLSILAVRAGLNSEEIKRHKKYLTKCYAKHLGIIRRRPELSSKTCIKLTAYQLCPLLFRFTTKNKELF